MERGCVLKSDVELNIHRLFTVAKSANKKGKSAAGKQNAKQNAGNAAAKKAKNGGKKK